jgi:hypothetical protein
MQLARIICSGSHTVGLNKLISRNRDPIPTTLHARQPTIRLAELAEGPVANDGRVAERRPSEANRLSRITDEPNCRAVRVALALPPALSRHSASEPGSSPVRP